MSMDDIARRGLVLFGCGHMGSAMLKGWLARGLAPQAITVIDRSPSDWLRAQGVRLNGALPGDPAAVV
ncbi:NAD(P)-binding domain-containing protein, partial [Pontibaca methylaminivorans]|uniref:NAD(P)-binding domain-containing protein n=1 Tax=Pontibaca methylaminivorans TaxID=515897 RepID=UPI002FDAEEFE